jgi:triosephosphate isomerase
MKTIVVANWKMNPATFREAKKLFEAERKAAEKSRGSSVVIAPPAIFLRELAQAYRGSKISFAAQNAHFEAGGAHTGDISLAQARDARARYVIVGHAERRATGETDDDARKKVAAALSHKMMPILCVGESERSESGEQFKSVRAQLREGLKDVAASALPRVLVVYEPLWTIGKKTTMSPRDMHQMAIFMRKCVVDSHGEAGRSLKILYGGSVDGKSAAAMRKEGDVRGFLVGRASVDAEAFTGLLQAIEGA